MSGKSDDVADKPIDPTDRTQFEEVYKFCRADLLRYVQIRVKDTAAAEDILQDVVEAVWEGAEKIATPNQTYGGVIKYLSATTRNKTSDYFKKQKRLPVVPFKEDGNKPEGDDANEELLALIQDENSPLWKGIKQEDREILLAHFLSGKSYKEIKELYGFNREVTVRQRVRRTLKRIEKNRKGLT